MLSRGRSHTRQRSDRITAMQYVSGEWADVPTLPQQSASSPFPLNKICVVLPFIGKEKDQATELLKRSTELCGQIQRTIFLVPFKDIEYQKVKSAAEQAFSTVATIQDSEGKESDWQGRQQMRNAAGPNSFFRQVAWFFYLNKRFGSWLWIEPDCWPNSSRWLYELEQEHFDAGKPFTGVQMTFPGTAKNYMNGVGIYPWNAVQYAPLLVQSTMWTQHPDIEVGFDVAGGTDVLSKAHITKKIQLLNYLARGSQEVRPETVLCHGRPDLGSVVESGHDNQPNESPDSTEGMRRRVNPYIAGSSPAGRQDESLDEVKRGVAITPIVGTSGSSAPPAQTTVESKTFLDGTSAMGEPSTSVLKENQSVQSPCVPDHSTPVQESNYGSVSKEIRFHVERLKNIWGDSPSRKVLIVKELRNAKLVPKHFR